MLKTKISARKLLLATLTALMCLFFVFAISGLFNQPIFAYDVTSDIVLEDEYVIGSEIVIPTKTVSVDGKTAQASFILCYPGGKASTDKNNLLDEVGNYKIFYSCEIDNKKIAFEEEFSVIQKLATYGSKTTVQYGEVKGLTDVIGLNVRLAKGDTLTINEIIDIDKATKADTLISSFVTTDVKGANDFTRLIYTFTDISDPSTFFSISSRSAIDGLPANCTWVQACANEQPYAGYLPSTNTIFVGGTWGTQIGHSFFSYYYNHTTNEEIIDFYGKKLLKFSYNNASKELFAIDNIETDSGLIDLVSKVADFDDSDFFTSLWRGFKSGKARLSVTAEGLVGETANFVITELFNVDLSKATVTKFIQPTITVDNLFDEMPKAKVGANYLIPSATAVDYKNEKCDLSVGVWYNYASKENAVMIDVKDNLFETKYSGLYTIVYTATDKEGNTSDYELWVETDNNILPPQIRIPTDAITEVNRGEALTFSEPTILYGSGKKQLLTILTFNNKETIIDNTYRFMEEGKYTLTYHYTDYVGQEAKSSYQINVINGANPVFIDKPVFDDYFVTDTAYDLPRIYASDFSSGKENKILATIIVTDKNGTRALGVGEKYTPSVENNLEKINIRYIAKDSELEYEIPTILSWAKVQGSSRTRLQIQNYFIKDGIELTKSSSGSTITAQSSNGSWTFANNLVAEQFNCEIKAVNGKSLFDGLKITLKDSQDKSIAITIKITKNKAKSLISYGNVSKEIDEGFTASSVSRVFGFVYKDKTIQIGKGVLELNFDDNGKKFKGFPSQKIILSVAFENASVGAEYVITSINGQPVSDMATDRISPKIVLLSKLKKVVSKDTQYVLPVAIVGDVLDPNTTVSLNVYTPSNEVAKATDGTLLEGVSAGKAYTILLDSYGVYNIEYRSQDAFGSSEAVIYSSITVEDCDAPTIQLLASFKKDVKVGDTIVIPQIKVTDNLTPTDKIIVRKYVYTPNGSLITIPNDSNSFKCIYEGEYEFRFVGMDDIGNVNVFKVKVNVTK